MEKQRSGGQRSMARAIFEHAAILAVAVVVVGGGIAVSNWITSDAKDQQATRAAPEVLVTASEPARASVGDITRMPKATREQLAAKARELYDAAELLYPQFEAACTPPANDALALNRIWRQAVAGWQTWDEINATDLEKAEFSACDSMLRGVGSLASNCNSSNPNALLHAKQLKFWREDRAMCRDALGL